MLSLQLYTKNVQAGIPRQQGKLDGMGGPTLSSSYPSIPAHFPIGLLYMNMYYSLGD